ncbi:hypothetical protein [Micromonospora sp. NPDC049102]
MDRHGARGRYGRSMAVAAGWYVPADREPAPQITQCVPVSGGRGCPGG